MIATPATPVDPAPACLADPDSACDQCEALVLAAFSDIDSGLASLIDAVHAVCPALDLTVSPQCVPEAPESSCVDLGEGCDQPVEYIGVSLVLEASPALSTLEVVHQGVSSGLLPVTGTMYLAGSPDPRVLVGALHVPDTQMGGSAYEGTFLLVNEDLDLNPGGQGHFRIPASADSLSTISSMVDGEGTTWFAELARYATGRIGPEGTWWLDYRSSVAGTTVDLHLEGQVLE